MIRETHGEIRTTETKKLEIEPIDFDALPTEQNEQPILTGEEQLPQNRSTKYEDYNIYELE